MNQRDYTRRVFLRLAGAASALSGRLGASAPRPAFEVSASLYAWDLHDEGIEPILDNLQQMAAVNSVYLVALMHKEKRPFTSDAFPHNPVRKTWQAEDARVYWRPDPKRYGRIPPRLSDVDWLNRTDWLKEMITAVRKRGLKTGVEISHTVLDGERAEGQFPDCMQRDINGKPLILWNGRAHPVCLNNPDVRQYVLGLWSDLTANYDVDYVQTCMIPFAEGGPATGGCFCDACRREGKEAGFDLDKARRALLADPGAKAELDAWQAFRRASVVKWYQMLSYGVHAIRPQLDVRFNAFMHNTEAWGVDLRAMKPHLNSLRVMEYSEQRGDPAAMNFKRKWLTETRAALGRDFPALSAIAVRPKATPELIRQGVQIAVDCGMNGITLGHYDGAEFPMLRAIRDGLTAAKVTM